MKFQMGYWMAVDGTSWWGAKAYDNRGPLIEITAEFHRDFSKEQKEHIYHALPIGGYHD